MSHADTTALDGIIPNPIVRLVRRKDITEIYINDDGYLRYQSQTEGKVKTNCYMPPDEVRAFIEFVAGHGGKVVNEMESVSAASEQQSASAGEIATASDSLAQLAQKLSESLHKFQY